MLKFSGEVEVSSEEASFPNLIEETSFPFEIELKDITEIISQIYAAASHETLVLELIIRSAQALIKER